MPFSVLMKAGNLVYPFASMRACAWRWVKLFAPLTGVEELLASGDLMAGFCGPF